MTKMYLSATLGMLDWLETASCSLWRWRYKTAVHAFSVYAVALYLDVPLFAFI